MPDMQQPPRFPDAQGAPLPRRSAQRRKNEPPAQRPAMEPVKSPKVRKTAPREADPEITRLLYPELVAQSEGQESSQAARFRLPKPSVRTLVRALLFVVAAGVCFVIFYVVVIMGESVARPPAPALPAQISGNVPNQQITELWMLSGIDLGFPAPILMLEENYGYMLTQGMAESIRLKDGTVGRRIELTYVHFENGGRMTISSIIPEAYLGQLASSEYVLSNVENVCLVRLPAVLMRRGNEVRIHAVDRGVLYILESDNIDAQLLARIGSNLKMVGEQDEEDQ